MTGIFGGRSSCVRALSGLALVMALGGSGCSGADPAGSSDAPAAVRASSVVFPLVASTDKRYLTDSRGAPFPILGRASWVVLSLPKAEYERYLDDTASKGFDAIEVAAIDRSPEGNRVPYDGEGEAPFARALDGRSWTGQLTYRSIATEAPDFTRPNERYWAFVDGFVDACASRGIAVLLFPAYVGFANSAEGWMNEMVANGPERMRAYGRWVATRYRERKNIIWMLGGDQGTAQYPFSPPQLEVERAFITGLLSVSGQGSQHTSAEWQGPSATSQTDFASYITLDGAYAPDAAPYAAAFARQAYAHTPVRPAFLLEEPYDEEGPDGNGFNRSATQPVRRFEWWGWLGSIGGYVAGNGYVWPFKRVLWRPGAWYTSHLDTQNTRDLKRLNHFIRSLPWYELVPDGLGSIGTLVPAGRGTPDTLDYIAAAATPDGRWLIAYIGPARSAPFTVDLTKLRGPVLARWLDPSSASSKAIGTFRNDQPHEFTVPGQNATGYRDWVLMLTSP